MNRAIVSFLEIARAGVKFQSACLLDDSVEEEVWRGPSVATLKAHTDVVGFWEEKEDFLEGTQPATLSRVGNFSRPIQPHFLVVGSRDLNRLKRVRFTDLTLLQLTPWTLYPPPQSLRL